MCCDLKDSEALIAFAKRRPKNIPCCKIKYLPKFRVKYTWRLVLCLSLEQPLIWQLRNLSLRFHSWWQRWDQHVHPLPHFLVFPVLHSSCRNLGEDCGFFRHKSVIQLVRWKMHCPGSQETGIHVLFVTLEQITIFLFSFYGWRNWEFF